jgi:hypothetical protein
MFDKPKLDMSKCYLKTVIVITVANNTVLATCKPAKLQSSER